MMAQACCGAVGGRVCACDLGVGCAVAGRWREGWGKGFKPGDQLNSVERKDD